MPHTKRSTTRHNVHLKPQYDRELGASLKKYRLKNNLRQEDVSRAAGVSLHAFWHLERGAYGTKTYDAKWHKLAVHAPELQEMVATKVGGIPPVETKPAETPVSEGKRVYDEMLRDFDAGAFILTEEHEAIVDALHRQRRMALRRKADHALTLARRVLQGASDRAVEDKAFELMTLDEQTFSTMLNLAGVGDAR
jgi:transcriptional regulator with XRE-family HTH domain